MRIAPALAAMFAAISRVFTGRPKVTRSEMSFAPGPFRGHVPSLRGTGKASRALRAARRQDVMRSFTRSLAHAVMRDPAISADPSARRKWRNERKRERRAS